MRGTNKRCRNALPLRVIPERGQAADHLSESSVGKSEAWHVLHDDDEGSNVANDSLELGPEPPVISGAGCPSGLRHGLTGEPAHDGIALGKITGPYIYNILPSWHLGPVFLKYSGAVGVVFDLGDALPPGPFEAEVHATDP